MYQQLLSPRPFAVGLTLVVTGLLMWGVYRAPAAHRADPVLALVTILIFQLFLICGFPQHFAVSIERTPCIARYIALPQIESDDEQES